MYIRTSVYVYEPRYMRVVLYLYIPRYIERNRAYIVLRATRGSTVGGSRRRRRVGLPSNWKHDFFIYPTVLCVYIMLHTLYIYTRKYLLRA